MASLAKTLRQAVRRLGPVGTLGLFARKLVKRQRYAMMLREVPRVKTQASLRESGAVRTVSVSDRDRSEILRAADRMLADDNQFFQFTYHLKGIERLWEYDPIEEKHWPRGHYTEHKLHARDTPRDVKIVWEINRFVDLPTLAEAAYLTRDARYAQEIEERLLSWIEENPFAHTINWASALEIAIRLLSWTTSIELLRMSGFNVHANDRIRRSIYEQARYLSADLSLDKVQPTNHLIGEAAGLLVAATFWDYPTAKLDAAIARKILEQQILLQTFADGATREATSWYHQFVTGFFDIADRVTAAHADPMSAAFRERLSRMKAYLAAMTYDGTLVRYGDADDGWPLRFTGDQAPWLDAIFGMAPTNAANSDGVFPDAKQAALRVGRSFVFVRGGEFGMGGAGFSSHAHDDFLSPIIVLDGVEVLADPGTFVYNGDRDARRKYRGAEAHNSLVIGESTGARQRMNFGWHVVRPPASLEVVERTAERALLRGSYAEWPEHTREIEVGSAYAIIRDRFARDVQLPVCWRFHLAPRWKPIDRSEFKFTGGEGNRLEIALDGKFDAIKFEHYDYSPAYRVSEQAFALELLSSVQAGTYAVRMSISREKPTG